MPREAQAANLLASAGGIVSVPDASVFPAAGVSGEGVAAAGWARHDSFDPGSFEPDSSEFGSSELGLREPAAESATSVDRTKTAPRRYRKKIPLSEFELIACPPQDLQRVFDAEPRPSVARAAL